MIPRLTQKLQAIWKELPVSIIQNCFSHTNLITKEKILSNRDADVVEVPMHEDGEAEYNILKDIGDSITMLVGESTQMSAEEFAN